MSGESGFLELSVKERITQQLKYCLGSYQAIVKFTLSRNDKESRLHNLNIFDCEFKFKFMDESLEMIDCIHLFIDEKEKERNNAYVRFHLQDTLLQHNGWEQLTKEKLYRHFFHNCLHHIWEIECQEIDE